MAWAETLQDASFRGVPFEVESVSRMGARSLAAHEYPYAAGADLEDMNIGPRQVQLRAVFYGDDYEARAARLISALEAPGPAYLVHPVHGAMLVMAERWADDLQADFEGTTVSMSFVERGTFTPLFEGGSASAKTDAVSVAASTARAAADDALVSRVAAVPATSWQRITALKAVFGQARQSLQALLSVTSNAKALLSDLDPVLYPRAYAADLLAVVDQALQGLPFGGRNMLYSGSAEAVVGSGLQDFETVRRTLAPASIELVPGVPVPDAVMTVDQAVAEAHARVHAATAIAECAAIVLAGELESTLLDRADIDSVTSQARAALQVAIDAARSTFDDEGRALVSQGLRDLAWRVQDAARAVVNQRPPLVSRPAPVGGPVRLVAHAIHGDADRAIEIARLNRLGRRVLVDAGEALNVYAR